MNYLYFAEGAVETTGEAAMFPADAFLGADPISATTTRLSFKARNNTAVDDDILVEHASAKHVEVAELIASLLEPSPVTRTKFIVVLAAPAGVMPKREDKGNIQDSPVVSTVPSPK